MVLVPQVISREPDIHPNDLEGGAKPKAMLVYAQTPLNIKSLKECGIKAHVNGVLFYPRIHGDISTLALRLNELQLSDTPPGLENTQSSLDARILDQLRYQYKEFATLRIVPTMPSMGMAMALI